MDIQPPKKTLDSISSESPNAWVNNSPVSDMADTDTLESVPQTTVTEVFNTKSSMPVNSTDPNSGTVSQRNRSPLVAGVIALLVTILIAGFGTFLAKYSANRAASHLPPAQAVSIQSVNTGALEVAANTPLSDTVGKKVVLGGNTSVTGDVNANYFIGNGSKLTNLNASNCPDCAQLQAGNSVTPQNGNLSVTGNGHFGSIGIGINSPAYALDVVGDINASKSLKVGGNTVCTSQGCLAINAVGSVVSSLNGTTGAITLQGTANRTIVTISGATLTVSTPQDIATSSSPSFSGLSLSNALGVSSGGTGTTSLSQYGVVIGNGTGALTTQTGPSAGLCLVSTATSPTFQTCPGGGGVTSLNNLTGALNITGTANQITVDTSSPNISLSLPQNIDTSSSVTFGQLAVNSIVSSSALSIGLAAQTLTLQGNGSTTFSATSGSNKSTLGFTTPTANRTINLPDESGTICLQNSTNCGFATGGSGVTALNSLSGSLTLTAPDSSIITSAGTTITIGSATTALRGLASFNSTNFSVTSGAVNTIQNIATSSTPSFAGLVLTGPNGLTVGNSTNAGQANFKDGTSDGFTGTIRTNTLTANQTIAVPNASGTFAVSASGNLSLDALGNLTIVDNPNFATSVTTPSLTSSSALAITAGGTLTVGSTNQTLTLQGSGSSTLSVSSSGNVSTLGFVTPTASRTINLPNESGTICLQNSTNCGFATGGSGVTALNGLSGSLTIANATTSLGTTITIQDASTTQKGIVQFSANDFTFPSSGNVDTVQGIASTSSPTFAGLSINGNIVVNTAGIIKINNIQQTAAGQNLTISANGNPGDHITFRSGTRTFDFPTSGSSSQIICTSGITCASGGGQAVLLQPGSAQTDNGTGTSISVNQIGSGDLLELAVSGTDVLKVSNGGVTTVSSLTVTNNATVSGSLLTNTITPSSALQIGATSQQFTLQGNSSSVLTATGGGHLTTVGFNIGSGGTAPSGDITYQFQNDNTVTPGTYNVCTTAGNCAGVGGGVTTSGGTAGHIAKFSSGSAIANSIITESGTVIGIAGSLNVTGANGISVGNAGSTVGNLVFANATNTNTITLQASSTPGNVTINVPGAGGTLAVSASGPLSLDSNGNLTCTTCLTSGGGAGGGVSSVDTINGAITISNSSNTSSSNIAINNASTTQKGIAQFNSTNFSDNGSGTINTIQDIATTSSPTFTNLTAQGPTGLTVGSTTNTGQIVFKDGTSDGFTSTLKVNTLTASQNISVPNASGTLAVSASGNIQLSATGNLTTVNNPTFSTSVTTPSLNSSGVLAIVPGGTLTVGVTTQTLTLQGNGSTTFSATSGSNKSTLGFTTPTANRTINLPDESGTICLQNSTNCGFATGGSGVTALNSLSGSLTLTAPDSSIITSAGTTITIGSATTALRGLASFNSTNFSVTSGAVNTIQNIATSSTPSFAGLSLTNSSNSLSLTGTPTNSATTSLFQLGNAISGGNIAVNGGTYIGLNAPGSGAGSTADLLNLQVNGSSQLKVTSTGVATIAGGLTVSSGGANITGGLTSTGTITFSGLSTAGIVTNTSAGVLGTETTVPVSQGGTGDSTLAVNGVLVSNTTGTGNVLVKTGSNGQCLVVTAGVPTFSGCGSSVSLQTVYDNSTTQPQITLDNSPGAGGLIIRDNSTPVGGNLLALQNNAGSTTFLGVSTAAVNIADAVNITGATNVTGAFGATGAITFSGLTTAGLVTNTSGGVLGTETTVSVNQGGTGIATFGAGGGVPYSTGGTGALSVATLGTNGQCLTIVSGVPTFSSCASTGSGSTLQAAYNNSTGGTTPEILLDTTRNGLDIQDANTTLGATTNLFAVRGSATATTLGPQLFNVQGNGNVGVGVSGSPSALFAVGGSTGNLTVDTSGNVITAGTYNSNTFNGNTLTFGTAGTATIQSAASQALNITANAASTWSTTSGNLTVQAAGTNTLILGTGGAGTVNLGTANSATINIGNTNAATVVNLSGGNTSSAIAINTASGGTISVGTSASNTTVLGSNSGTGRVEVGTNGTPTGQLYVGGVVPTSATGSASTTNAPWYVYVQGRYAYIINQAANTLQIFDVSNPASPVSIGSVATGSSPFNVYVQGRYAYVTNDGASTLQIFDVSNPASPASVGSVATGTAPQGVYVQGRYAYVTNVTSNTLQIFDVSNPASPVSIGSVATSSSSRSVYVQGRYAYVANYGGGTLQIFDVSNPASPASVGSVATGTSPFNVYVQGRYAYVTNSGSGTLQIFDVSNPASPASVGSVATGSTPQGVYVQGRYAYVSNYSVNTLQIFDVSNPASPASVGTVSTGTGPRSVYVQGRYAYVANWGASTLQVFDLGGAYSQQLQAGGIETGTLQTNGNATVNGDASISGGLTVGQSLQTTGNLGVSGSALFVNQTNSTTAFQIQNSSAQSLLTVDTTGSNVTIGLSGGGTTTLQSSSGVAISSLGTAGPVVTYLCRNSSNIIATCSTTANGAAFVQGGNSFGVTAVLGTNDNNSLTFKTNGNTQATIASGGATVFENSTNSTTAFQVQNASTSTVLDVDTTNGRVGIGTATPGDKLEVVGNIISKGTAWSAQTAASTSPWQSVAYGNGLFVAVHNGGTSNSVMTSPDGINWTSRTAATNTWKSITYGNGLFVAVSNDGTSNSVMTSPDGINWTSRTAAASNYWNSVTYGNGLFVAVSDTSAGTIANRVMTSPDGINWTSRTAAANNSWYAVTYGNGLFVAVSATGTGNRVMTSPDGINWTSRTSTNDYAWVAVTYGNGLFTSVACGTNLLCSGNTAGVMTSGKTDYVPLSSNNIYQGGLTVRSGDVLFSSGTNSTTAFQIQNSSSSSLLTADASNMRIGIDTTYASLAVPTGLSVGTATSGGSLTASTTYYYKVTAIDSAGGETSPSTEASAATSASNLTLPVTWTTVTGSSGYKVYRSTTTGTEVYLTTVLTNSYTDNGSIVIGTATPPGTNTAVKSTNNSNSSLQLSIGGNGTPTGQLYVSGTVPATALGSVATGNSPWYLYVQGRYAYVINRSSSTLQIFDVSSPASPVSVGSVATSSTPQGLYVQGRYAYVVAQTSTLLQIIDVSNPASPVSVGSVSVGSNPQSVYVQGRYAYVANRNSNNMQIIDVSNPASPVSVGAIKISGVLPHYVYVQGRYAYLGEEGSTSLAIIDISSPTNPVLAGTMTTTGTSPEYVYVQGRYAYVVNVNSTSILQIFDVSNPASPVSVGSANTGSAPQGIYVQGRYAYVINQTSATLQIFDVSNPASPVSIGTVATGSGPLGLYVQGRYAYVANSSANTLQTFDLGGTYDQQLQAGGIETGTLQTNGNAIINGDLSLQGGLSVGASLQTTGTISGGGLTIGGILATPSAPTVTSQGTTGNTNYLYQIVAQNNSGSSAPSPIGTTPNGNGTLSSSNKNHITWAAISGATGYTVYRVVSGGTPSTTGIIGGVSGNGTLAFDDTGLAGDGSSVPTSASAGQLTANGAAVFQDAQASTGAFQVLNTSGGSLINVDTTGSGTVGIGTGSSAAATINIGTAASSQTVNIGNSTGGSTTDSINIGTASNLITNITAGSTAVNTFVSIQGGGGISIGTGAVATTITLGSSTSNTVTNVIGGLGGGINLGSSGFGNINIGNGSASNAIQIGSGLGGTSGLSQAIRIGNNGNATSTTILLGANNGVSQVDVGNNGTPTGQLYVSGIVPTAAVGSVATGTTPQYVYVQGRYAYVVNTSTPVLQIFDVSNSSSPVSVGSVATGTAPNSVYVQGRYAYVTNQTSNTLQIFDVSNPASPFSVGSIGTLTTPKSVYVQGRYAYVPAQGSNILEIFDVSNPASPAIGGTVGTGGSSQPTAVYVQGHYAYVTNIGTSTANIYDVSSPTTPFMVGSVSTGAVPRSIYVQGRYAYITNFGSSTLQIIDVSNPASPNTITSFSTGGGGYSVYVQGRYAYLTYASALQIIDVSNPASPASVGTVATGTVPQSLYVQGRYAYVINATSSSLQIFDLGGTYDQQLQAGGIETGTLQTNGDATINGDLTLQGGLTIGTSLQTAGNASVAGLIVGNALASTTSVSVTAQGTTGSAFWQYRIAAYNTSGSSVAIGANVVNGNTTLTGTNKNHITWAAVTGATGYIIYRSISGGTPSTTGIIGNVSSGTLAFDDTGLVGDGTNAPSNGTAGLLSAGGAATFQDTVSSAAAFQVLNPSGAQLIGVDTSNNIVNIGNNSGASTVNIGNTSSNTNGQTINIGYNAAGSGTETVTLGNPFGRTKVEVGGNVGTPTGQLYVSGSSTGSALASINTGGNTYGIAVQGRYAYTTNCGGTPDLQITDVSNPASPVNKGSVGTTGCSINVSVQGHYAYLTTTAGLFLVIDVSNPSAPAIVNGSGTSLGISIFNTIVQGHYAYIIGQGGTLKVYDIINPVAPTNVASLGIGSTTSFAVNGSYIQGRYLYIAEYISGQFQIIDINNPLSPSVVSTVNTNAVGYQATSIYVQGRYAYLMGINSGGDSDSSALLIYDISNPASPSYVSTSSTGSDAYGIYVQGRYAYAVWDTSLYALDISNPTGVGYSIYSQVPSNGGLQVYVQGRYTYVTTGNTNLLEIYDSGGEYAQQLQAGGIETGTLQTTGNAVINGDQVIQGGLTLGQGLEANGNVGVTGSVSILSKTNSTTAFQVQNSSANTLLSVDTTNNNVSIDNSGVAGTVQIGSTTGAISQTIGIGNNATASSADTITIGNLLGTSSTTIQGGTGASAVNIQAGSGGSVNINTTNSITSTTNIATTTNSTQNINIGYSGSVGGGSTTTLSLGNPIGASVTNIYAGSGGINIGTLNNSTPAPIQIGTISAAVSQGISIGNNGTTGSTDTVTIGSTQGSSTTTIQGGTGNITLSVPGNSKVLIGQSSGTIQELLQLDTYSTYSDTATCATSTNQGAMYYNSNSSSSLIRTCVNGSWNDLVSTDGLGIFMFGVSAGSGSNAGDILSITGAGDGPCKVSWASTISVSVAPCTAYSGGRKVIVSSTTVSGMNGASGWYHVCLNGTNNQPIASVYSVSETGNLPTFSASAPILCLADVQTGGGGTIINIYDTRVFLDSRKAYATISTTAAGLGWLVKQTGTTGQVTPTSSASDGNVRGVVVASTGAASTNTINGIIATSGAVFVKATGTSSVNALVIPTTTTGYSGTGTNSTAYGTLGIAQRTIDTTCTAASDCQYSQFVDLDIK